MGTTLVLRQAESESVRIMLVGPALNDGAGSPAVGPMLGIPHSGGQFNKDTLFDLLFILLSFTRSALHPCSLGSLPK